MKQKKVFVLLSVIIIISILLAGCGEKKEDIVPLEPVTKSLFAMDTYMTLTAYGDHAEEGLKQAEEKILQLDNMLSSENEESEIYKLNHQGNAVLAQETAYLISRSIEVHRMSEGSFNPLVYPLMSAWGFTTKKFRVPSNEEIRGLLDLTDIQCVEFDEDNNRVSFSKKDMMIDLGGIAKGYTSSCIMDIFKNCGVESACISLGGNVHVLGSKPDGSEWKIAIRDPNDMEGYLGMLKAADTAVITSGAYERNFEEDGVLYHHILDPSTGYPANNGIRSSTIVCNDGTLADALSTAVYVMGLEKAEQMWRENRDSFDMILMTEENRLYITQGLEKCFQSDRYEICVIE